MDVTVPERIRPLRDRFEAFVEERIIPQERVLQLGFLDPQAEVVLAGLQQEAKDEGLWAPALPKSMGGGGLPLMDYVYINEVIGRSEPAIYVFGTHSLHDCLMLDQYASPKWRDKYLAPLAAGEIAGPSFAMTEKNVSSSDPTQLAATAVLEGDEWVINGEKWFTTHAHSAKYTVVMVRTETDAPIHKSFSMIIVPTDTPGYEIVRSLEVMGETSGDHCEVRYNNVRVPAENLLGERGSGFAIAQKRLGPGRIFHVMRFLGQAQRAFDLLCERAVSRTVFGEVMADKQLIQQMIFETAAEIRTVRLLTLEAAQALQDGGTARIDISMVKVLGARMLQNAVDRALQVHGSIGLTADLPLERMYRIARFGRIYDGPDEAHIATAARLLVAPYRKTSGQ